MRPAPATPALAEASPTPPSHRPPPPDKPPAIASPQSANAHTPTPRGCPPTGHAIPARSAFPRPAVDPPGCWKPALVKSNSAPRRTDNPVGTRSQHRRTIRWPAASNRCPIPSPTVPAVSMPARPPPTGAALFGTTHPPPANETPHDAHQRVQHRPADPSHPANSADPPPAPQPSTPAAPAAPPSARVPPAACKQRPATLRLTLARSRRAATPALPQQSTPGPKTRRPPAKPAADSPAHAATPPAPPTQLDTTQTFHPYPAQSPAR